jgi:hypothetical protein
VAPPQDPARPYFPSDLERGCRPWLALLVSTPGLATRPDWPLGRRRPQGPPPNFCNSTRLGRGSPKWPIGPCGQTRGRNEYSNTRCFTEQIADPVIPILSSPSCHPHPIIPILSSPSCHLHPVIPIPTCSHHGNLHPVRLAT